MIILACKTHPQYKAHKFPKSNCYACVKIYDLSRSLPHDFKIRVLVESGKFKYGKAIQ